MYVEVTVRVYPDGSTAVSGTDPDLLMVMIRRIRAEQAGTSPEEAVTHLIPRVRSGVGHKP